MILSDGQDPVVDAIFDGETHTYRDIGGREYPSVTQILKEEGVIDSRFHNDEARDRGTAVHKIIGELLGGPPADVPWDMQAEAAPYVAAFESWWGMRAYTPIAVEKPMIHETWGYAGTPDLVARFNDTMVIVDFKTGAPARWHSLQTAAYAMLWGQDHHDMERYSLYLKPNGKAVEDEHKNKRDFHDWRAFVSVNAWKKSC